ncbi:MAG: cupin domain-containing protein [Terriglobia bacterium]
MTRRETTKAFALMMTAGFSGLMGKAVWAETPHGSPDPSAGAGMPSQVKQVLQHLLPGTGEKEGTIVTVSYAPGASSKPHRHPGPVFAYILEGAVVSQVEPGPPITYEQGQAFYEPPMHVHRISRNASQTRPAKLLAFQITKKGQPLTLPAE